MSNKEIDELQKSIASTMQHIIAVYQHKLNTDSHYDLNMNPKFEEICNKLGLHRDIK